MPPILRAGREMGHWGGGGGQSGGLWCELGPKRLDESLDGDPWS